MPNTFHNNTATVALILLFIAFIIGTMTFGELLALALIIGFFWWLGLRSLKRLDFNLASEIAKRQTTEVKHGDSGQSEEPKSKFVP